MNLLQRLFIAGFGFIFFFFVFSVSQGTTLKPNAVLGHEKPQQRSNKQILSASSASPFPQTILLVLLFAGFHLGADKRNTLGL